MNKLLKSLSVLAVVLIVYYAILLGYTLINYKILSEGEWWGIVYMIGFALVGIPLIISEIIIRFITKNKYQRNKLGLIVLMIFLIIIVFLGFN